MYSNFSRVNFLIWKIRISRYCRWKDDLKIRKHHRITLANISQRCFVNVNEDIRYTSDTTMTIYNRLYAACYLIASIGGRSTIKTCLRGAATPFRVADTKKIVVRSSVGPRVSNEVTRTFPIQIHGDYTRRPNARLAPFKFLAVDGSRMYDRVWHWKWMTVCSTWTIKHQTRNEYRKNLLTSWGEATAQKFNDSMDGLWPSSGPTSRAFTSGPHNLFPKHKATTSTTSCFTLALKS